MTEIEVYASRLLEPDLVYTSVGKWQKFFSVFFVYPTTSFYH